MFNVGTRNTQKMLLLAATTTKQKRIDLLETLTEEQKQENKGLLILNFGDTV